MKQLAFILILLVAGPAWAAFPHDAVCDVTCPPCGGSGTLVGIAKGRGLVISAAHVFEDGNRNNITCYFPATKQRCRGRILGFDWPYDLAALDIDAPNGIETPKVVVARRDDGPYTCVGFPWNANNQLRWTRGEYLGYAGGGQSSWAPSMLHTRTHVISGYSGGARFNRYGEYVGVVSGMTGTQQNMDRTWGASGSALIRFVKRWMEVEE